MDVARDRVVRFHYELTDDGGEALGSSRGGEPVSVLVGHGNVLPGVEAAIAGHAAGSRVDVELAPEDAYGARREGWTQRLQRKHLPGGRKLRAGMQTVIRTAQGPQPVTVIKAGASVVEVDRNHPLAGRRLRFAIEIVDVREADADEIAHGHVHGPGGHGH